MTKVEAVEIATEAGIGNFPKKFLDRVLLALLAGDEHLNSIPLTIWDAMGMYDMSNIQLRGALSRRGMDYCLSYGVMMRKEKAKQEAGEL